MSAGIVFNPNLKLFIRLRALQPPVPMPAARGAQRVNDEAVKILNLLSFVYFSWKWGETFEKLQSFTFGPKQCCHLNHSAPEYLEKLAIKKKTENGTWNGCISKARKNSESKLTFSESSFNFLEKSTVFCTLYPRGYTQGAPPPTTPDAAASGSCGSKS